jgi:hypothetical protein
MSATERILESARLEMPSSNANRMAAIFGVIGVLGLAATGLGFLNEGERADALLSYLVAYMFLVTLSVGGIFFTLLQYLVGAFWSVPVRRFAENMAFAAPLLIVLFLPIPWGMKQLYPWAAPGPLPADIAIKADYLNADFFLIRAAGYLIIWAVLGIIVYRRSVAVDKSGDPKIILGMRKLSAPGILLFAISLTFAGFDWFMSTDPTWASTMFGVYIFAGTILSTLAAIVLTAVLLQRAGYLKDVINKEHYHDLGKLKFGFIVFWAYIAFSQYFLIWYANLPEETHWYRLHWEGGWHTVTLALVFLHFVIPFFTILSRYPKRNTTVMMCVALLLLVMHYVDLFWIIVPVKRGELSVHFRDITALVGMLGIGLAVLFNRMGAAPLIPIKDPLLKKALEYDNV